MLTHSKDVSIHACPPACSMLVTKEIKEIKEVPRGVREKDKKVSKLYSRQSVN